MKKITLSFAALPILLIACGTPVPHSKAVYLLVDTSGTYTDEIEKVHNITNYLLGLLTSDDSLGLARIDSASFSEKNIISKVTFDTRPSYANQQKRSFRKDLDHFITAAKGSSHTDITGGMLRLAAEAVTRRLVNAPGVARQRVSNAVNLARHPLKTLRETSEAFRSLAPMFTPALRPVSPLMQARSTRYRFEVLRMPLSELKSAAHSAGCKLNDAYLCGITGGWKRYHAHHDASVESLRAMIPMDLRGSDSGTVAGNRLSLARFSLPIQDEDAGQRMRRIREILGGQRQRPPAAWVETTAGILNLLPAAVFTATFGIMARSIDFIASCVLGPREPLYVAGARVEAILPFGPTAGAAANFTLFSHAGEVVVTINVDPASVPDPQRLRDCMTESFDEVLKLGRGAGPSLVPADSQPRNDLRNDLRNA